MFRIFDTYLNWLGYLIKIYIHWNNIPLLLIIWIQHIDKSCGIYEPLHHTCNNELLFVYTFYRHLIDPHSGMVTEMLLLSERLVCCQVFHGSNMFQKPFFLFRQNGHSNITIHFCIICSIACIMMAIVRKYSFYE